jgi:hypothetical protein
MRFVTQNKDSRREPYYRTGFVLLLVLLAWQLASSGATSVSSNLYANAPVEHVRQIAVGIILPVSLDDALTLDEARSGQLIEARIAQEVPLPHGEKVPLRSLVKGSILSVTKDSDGKGGSVTFKFNQLEIRKDSISIATSLRAIASFLAVRSAQMPKTGGDSGTPAGWGNTVLVGDDIRYGDGGIVRNRAKQKVGKGVFGGVLVHVASNPSLGCEGPVNGDDHPQALWVFSADACGVYGMKGAQIAHQGKTTPVGQIILHFEKDNAKVEKGAGMLLRVVSPQ